MLDDVLPVDRHAERFAIARAAIVPTTVRVPVALTPRSLPVLAEPVAPSAVGDSSDRFRCERLCCVITAGVCAERQRVANTRRHHGGWKLNRYQIAEAAGALHFSMCRRCPAGRGIAAKIGVTIRESSGNGYVDDEVFRGARGASKGKKR